MGGNDIGHIGNTSHGFLEAKKTFAAGIGFITLHDPGPLMTAHGGSTAVGQQVDQYIAGFDAESIEMGGMKNGFPFFLCRKIDGFNGFDPERFNDGFHVNELCGRATIGKDGTSRRELLM